MKNKTISILLILNLITTIGILNFFIKGQVNKEKEILKEMTESEQVSGMQTQINTLNESHEEYAINVQSYKRQIASAITDMGIDTPENADASTMSSNIRSILGTATTWVYSTNGKYKSSITVDNLVIGKEYFLFLFSYSSVSQEYANNWTTIKTVEGCEYELLVNPACSQKASIKLYKIIPKSSTIVITTPDTCTYDLIG